MGADANYGLESAASEPMPVPDLPYRPRVLPRWPRLGLIGCGGISETHLSAYRAAGYEVAILCDRTLAKAEARRDEFFPSAAVTTDPARVFGLANLDAVDLTPHPGARVELIRAAIDAGLPVLSQKPLARDLETARDLVEYAEAAGEPRETIENVGLMLKKPRDSRGHNDHLHVRLGCTADDHKRGACRDKLATRSRHSKWRWHVACPLSAARRPRS